MKKITLLLLALGLGSPAGFAQGSRIVCDETCRIEYHKTETPLQKQAGASAAAAKPAVKPDENPDTAKSSPRPSTKIRPASVQGYAVVSPVGRTSVEMITQALRLLA